MHMMIKSLILVGIIAIIAIFIQRTYFNDNPIAGENMQSGIEFLENNKTAEGVQVTDSADNTVNSSSFFAAVFAIRSSSATYPVRVENSSSNSSRNLAASSFVGPAR